MPGPVTEWPSMVWNNFKPHMRPSRRSPSSRFVGGHGNRALNPFKKTAFIVNPNAGAGSAAKKWRRIQGLAARLMGFYEAEVTKGPGDATRLAAEAARNGFDLVVCVGGDGTLNEIVNGLLSDSRGYGKMVLGYIPCGTGCDFSRTMGLPTDPGRAVEVIASGGTRTVDAGRIVFRGREGATEQRFFHNMISFGLGGEVDARVNRGAKALGGFLTFIRATLVSIILFRKKRIGFRLDNGPVFETMAWNIAVANGQYHGGGMWVAPEARPDDGLFHVTAIEDLALWEVFINLPKLYNGTLMSHPKIRSFVGRYIEAWSPERVLLDMDGEQPGSLPLSAEVVPSALRLAARPPGLIG